MARAVLSRRRGEEGLAATLRRDFHDRRNQWFILSNAGSRQRTQLARPDSDRLPIRLEGIEVHHSLELGAVLFQLPPHFSKNRERLASFIEMLPEGHRYAFEFRHESWYDDDILDVLHAHDVALCLSDHRDAPSPWVSTAGHVYLRGHGPGGQYRGSYPIRTLRRWADAIAAWQRRKKEIFVYFDNDQKAAAPKDAQRLIAMIDK
jgi:uncharacterized protein YecE (DUF72 family)